MGTLISNMFKIVFEILGFKIDFGQFVTTIQNLCNWTVIKGTSIWSLAAKLHQIIVPIGLSLLTLFFLLDIVKKTLEIDRLSWERMVFTFIRFFIFKMLIENSFELLTSIMSITNNLLLKVMSAVNNGMVLPDLANQMKDLVDNAGGILNTGLMAVMVLILYIPFMGTLVGVLVQIFVRIGKLIFAFAFSPIPIAIGTWEDGSNIAKRFIMQTVALGIEASMIVVATGIYSMALSSLTNAGSISTMIGVMFLNGFLMAMISVSSNLAEKWMGG